MAKQAHSNDDDEQRRVLDHNAFIRMYLEFLICLTKEEASYFHGDEDARNLSLDRDTNLIEREKHIFSTYGENVRGKKSALVSLIRSIALWDVSPRIRTRIENIMRSRLSRRLFSPSV